MYPLQASIDQSPATTGDYLYLNDVSLQSEYLQVDTVFPDGGVRRTVMLAESVRRCGSIECGDGPYCLRCVTNPLSGSSVPLLSPEARHRLSRVRSARSVSDLVRASCLDHLLTLSAGKRLKSRRAAFDAWSGYLADHRYGRWFNGVIGGRYVAVTEPYADGDGWHIHAAISGRLHPAHLQRLKVTWTAYLYHRLGIARPDTPKRLWRVHIAAPDGRRRSPRALGSYLGKYISKSFDEWVPGERRYRSGQGLSRPQLVRSTARLDEGQALDLVKSLGGYVHDIITADGRHVGWWSESPP